MSKIRAFSFRYGENTGKMEWYQVEDDNQAVCVRINRYDGQEEARYYEMEQGFLEDLNRMLMGANVPAWDGFYDISNTACSGDTWVMHLYYQDGEEAHAMGHTAYPEGFETGKQAILAFFKKLIQERENSNG